MQKHGPWTIVSSQSIYRDPWIEVVRDEVLRPDNAHGTYSTVELKSGVCVIAMDEKLHVHLTKEFHYAVGRVTIEGVSGGIETGESPLVSAQRELEEELGLQAAKWTHLGQVDPFTGSIRSTVDLYLAEELSHGEHDREGTELIEHVTMSLDEAVAMVKRSEISHAPSCVAILRIALESLGRS